MARDVRACDGDERNLNEHHVTAAGGMEGMAQYEVLRRHVRGRHRAPDPRNHGDRRGRGLRGAHRIDVGEAPQHEDTVVDEVDPLIVAAELLVERVDCCRFKCGELQLDPEKPCRGHGLCRRRRAMIGAEDEGDPPLQSRPQSRDELRKTVVHAEQHVEPLP